VEEAMEFAEAFSSFGVVLLISCPVVLVESPQMKIAITNGEIGIL